MNIFIPNSKINKAINDNLKIIKHIFMDLPCGIFPDHAAIAFVRPSCKL
jgi:hypothetical protein